MRASPLEAKETQIRQVQRLIGQGVHRERAASVALTPRGGHRTDELAGEQLPAHKELDGGGTGSLAAAAATPQRRQFFGQQQATAIFDHYGAELAQEGHRHSFFGLQRACGQDFEQSLQKGECLGAKALVDGRGRHADLVALQDLSQSIQGDLWLLEPAKDERLGKGGSRDLSLSLHEPRFSGQ